MQIKRLVCVAFLLFSISETKSQNYKLGKVTIAELQEKSHPKDSSAVAAILYKRGESRIEFDSIDNSFFVFTEVETRIKIYKKEGYNWANQGVQYWNTTNLKEHVFFEDAVTFNLVNGKIEKTKLKSDGSFDEVLNKNMGQKKITMPNVKEGSVIEFRYTIKCPSDRLIREWNFQTSIPVNYSEFSTFIPEYFVFNSKQKGYFSPKVITFKKPKSITYTGKEKRVGLSKPNNATQHFDYIENETNYIAVDVPALKEESYVNNIDNYRSSIEHELSLVKFPNSPMKEYSADWKSAVRTIYEYDDFGPELNKTGYFEDDLKILLDGKKKPEEKIWIIFNYIKAHVKWNGYMGYGCDSGVKKAYKEKTGNIADINLMLTAMLRYSGLTANPVLLSTRSNGIALFPNRSAFNYVIAAVETPDGVFLLDATDKFSTPNILPLRVLNWSGRLIRKDGTSEQIDLMPSKISIDNVFMSYSIDADGKVTGKTRRQCTDYNAMITRSYIDSINEDEYLEKLENENNKIEISEYTRTNEKDVSLPTIETYSFTGNNLCEVIGGKIYLNPMLFFTNDKNPFKQEVREYPVDFSYPFLDKYNITIKIPEGFTIETIPASAVFNMEENLGSFKFNITSSGNSLQLSIAHQINEAIVSTEKYEMLKDYYKAMVAKETEKIVLKRI